MKSVVGTPYTSIRHRDNVTVSVEMTPERAIENSLGAKVTLPREHPSLDATAATSFKRAPESEAEDRIGSRD